MEFILNRIYSHACPPMSKLINCVYVLHKKLQFVGVSVHDIARELEAAELTFHDEMKGLRRIADEIFEVSKRLRSYDLLEAEHSHQDQKS